MYQIEYRQLGISNENIVNRILRDVIRACEPRKAAVIGDFTPRGGISTRVSASWSKDRGYGPA